MDFPIKKIVNSEMESEQLAIEFAEILKKGNLVAISGDLGTGKTFFIKSVAKYFGIREVTSPTFSIVNTYIDAIKIHHFDFYRIKKEVELYDIGFDEYISDLSAIIFIEWAEMFEEILPNDRYIISIKNLGNSKREIIINKNL